MMFVKDIAAQAAFLLGKEDLFRYLKGELAPEEGSAPTAAGQGTTPSDGVGMPASDGQDGTVDAEKLRELKRDADILLRCYNIVENEVALDYLPLTAEETIVCDTGALPYTAFLRAPVSILSVTDEYGNKLPYTVFPEYLRTRAGTSVVTYSYSPESKRLCDASEYAARVPERLLSYGVACEYCLISGLYDEALVWDKKYKDALLCAHSASRPRVIRSRRWV